MGRFGLVSLLCLCGAPAAFACSVPVFRYALERWQPSKYELVVFHRGPLGPADRDSVRQLTAAARRANVRIVHADMAAPLAPGFQEVWSQERTATIPRLVLRYPDAGPDLPSAWSGPLSTAPATLFDSPARRALTERLTAGYAGVIVLLLSGDGAADAAARQFLRTESPRVANAVALPPRTEDGPQVMSVLPLRVEFPVIEVPRTAEEACLVQTLLRSEDGLSGVTGPIAFPVFGRGRALCSLHGSDLTSPAELRRSLEFLCRACSCQVKELNPGVDLLLAANWDAIFDAEVGPPPRVAGPAGPLRAESHPAAAGNESAAELRSQPPAGYEAGGLEPARRLPAGRSPLVRFGTLAAGALVVATGFWVFRGRRPPPPAGP